IGRGKRGAGGKRVNDFEFAFLEAGKEIALKPAADRNRRDEHHRSPGIDGKPMAQRPEQDARGIGFKRDEAGAQGAMRMEEAVRQDRRHDEREEDRHDERRPSVIASARKKKPGIPPSSTSGRNTTTLAAVEAMSGRATRPVARMMAVPRLA